MGWNEPAYIRLHPLTWKGMPVDEIFRQTQSLPKSTNLILVKIHQRLHHPTLIIRHTTVT